MTEPTFSGTPIYIDNRPNLAASLPPALSNQLARCLGPECSLDKERLRAQIVAHALDVSSALVVNPVQDCHVALGFLVAKPAECSQLLAKNLICGNFRLLSALVDAGLVIPREVLVQSDVITGFIKAGETLLSGADAIGNRRCFIKLIVDVGGPGFAKRIIINGLRRHEGFVASANLHLQKLLQKPFLAPPKGDFGALVCILGRDKLTAETKRLAAIALSRRSLSRYQPQVQESIKHQISTLFRLDEGHGTNLKRVV